MIQLLINMCFYNGYTGEREEEEDEEDLGVGYLYQSPLLRFRHCYPTTELLSYDNNNHNNTAQ